MARYDGGEGHFFLVTGVSTEMSVLPAFAEKVSLNILLKNPNEMYLVCGQRWAIQRRNGRLIL